MFKHCIPQNFHEFTPINCAGVPVFKNLGGKITIIGHEPEQIGVVSDFSLNNLINSNVPLKDMNFQSDGSLNDFDNANKVVQKILSDDEDKNTK